MVKRKNSMKVFWSIIIGIVAFIILIIFLISQTAGCQQSISHVKSAVVGLNRKITLYSNDGKIIKEWNVKGQVEDQGGSFRFLSNDKAVNVSGTVLIEEQ